MPPINGSLLAYCGRKPAQAADPATASAGAAELLAQAVTQFNVTAIEKSLPAAAGTPGCLLLVALRRRAPPSSF
jgi:hypothetical protein